MVYSIIHEHNLDQYYDIKKSSLPLRPATPASYSETPFAYLDSLETRELTFYLEGVHCVACLWLVEKVKDFVQGIEDLSLNLGTSVLTIRLNEDGQFSEVASQLARFGYYPHLVSSQDDLKARQQEENRKQLLRLGIAGAATGNIMLFSIALYAGADHLFATVFSWASGILCLPTVLYSAWPFYKNAFAAIRNCRMHIDIPVSLALILGFGFSLVYLFQGSTHIYFDSISTFVFLLLGTRYYLSKLHLSNSLETQFSTVLFTPKRLEKKQGDHFLPTDIKSIYVGDTIRLFPDDVVPVDGELLSESAYVDNHVITGESYPLHLKQNAMIYAGSTLLNHPCEITVTALNTNTRIGSLLQTIAHQKKSPIQEKSELVAAWFLYGVLVLSGLALYYLSFAHMLSLIIVSCPCALALATPLSYLMAHKQSISEGIVIKASTTLDTLRDISHVVFDKTGTLTQGQFSVLSVTSDQPVYLDVLCALEKESHHPIAKAVLRYCDPSTTVVTDVVEVPGKGIKGIWETHEIFVGAYPSQTFQTTIALYVDGDPKVIMALGDQLRPEAKDAILSLQKMGLNLSIYSGDSPEVVQDVASILGISDAYGGLSPEDKAEKIKDLSGVMMVGDGLNDTPALSEADVSVAVQGSLEHCFQLSDIYMTQPGISQIPGLFALARQTRRTIVRNIVLSISYNLIGISAVFLNLVSPLFAAVLMPLSAFSVFLSTLVGFRRSS